MAFFVLYILLIGVLIFNVYFAWQVHKELPVFVQKLPTLTFQKGHLVAPGQAVTVSVPKTPYVLVFDAQAKTPPAQQMFVEKKILAFIGEDHFYMPSVGGVSAQPLPEKLDGQITAQIMQPYLPAVRSFLQTAVFIGAFFVMGFFLVFSTLLAAAVVFFWRGLKQLPLPLKDVWRWAVLLQGPALILWCVQIIYGVPLFTFALFILFNIYVQQICNTWPLAGGKKYAA